MALPRKPGQSNDEGKPSGLHALYEAGAINYEQKVIIENQVNHLNEDINRGNRQLQWANRSRQDAPIYVDTLQLCDRD